MLAYAAALVVWTMADAAGTEVSTPPPAAPKPPAAPLEPSVPLAPPAPVW